MKTKIEPSETQIKKWVESYVPPKDFFFLQEEHLPLFEEESAQVLLIPKDEFFNHASYRQIQLVNSYEYWGLSKDVDYVIVAGAEWITNLAPSKKETLLAIQLKMNRGLIFPVSYFSEVPDFLKENLVKNNEDEFIVLTANLWKQLPFELKEQLMKEYSRQWDEWLSEEVPEQLPLLMKKYVNTFPAEGGSNCLAATLFAISQQEWMIHEWVHPQTFAEKLSRTNSFIETDELSEGDVLVWKTVDGQIQHASYHIGNQLFFNKSGQTFFNPWKIVSFSELQAEWSQYSLNVYRLIC